jgi:GNAT superfamily N-acetyltransferase
MTVREVNRNDLGELLALYTHLHGNPIPPESEDLSTLWEQILADRNHHIVVAQEDDKIVSSCVVVIIPNLTHHQRPYALVENVVTDEAYRNKGLATACLNYAKALAEAENCYKIMLMTGSKEESTLRFYERAGYNCNDKTAFIQWLK